MSVVEDIRQAVQDFVAPEIRELKARVEALEKDMEREFSAVRQQFSDLRLYLDSRFNSLQEMLALNERVAKLESERETHRKQ